LEEKRKENGKKKKFPHSLPLPRKEKREVKPKRGKKKKKVVHLCLCFVRKKQNEEKKREKEKPLFPIIRRDEKRGRKKARGKRTVGGLFFSHLPVWTRWGGENSQDEEARGVRGESHSLLLARIKDWERLQREKGREKNKKREKDGFNIPFLTKRGVLVTGKEGEK